MTNVHGLLLCAGQGQRMMGPNKLHLPFGDSTVLKTTLTALQGGGLKSLTAVTGHDELITQSVLKSLGVNSVHNSRYKTGLHSSIRAGIENLPEEGFVAICLADQPLIQDFQYQKLVSVAQLNPSSKLIAPTFNDKRGNPVLINLNLRSIIYSHPDEDRGCSYLFHQFPDDVILVPMETDSILKDLDSPEDYQCLKTSISSFKN